MELGVDGMLGRVSDPAAHELSLRGAPPRVTAVWLGPCPPIRYVGYAAAAEAVRTQPAQAAVEEVA